ncbi:MAG: glycosyltransferase family 4 protein [Planctomycetaceae bacterium]|nr:glycosyltransferase family 4 protein [Planctomycetaceae bacterium]
MSRLDRIVILDDTWNARGGASKLAYFLAEQLAARQFPVTYLTGKSLADDFQPTVPLEIVSAGCEYELADKSLNALKSALWNREVEQVFSQWMDKHDTPGTIYHLHAWSQVLSPSVFRALRQVDPRRVLLHAHDVFLVCPNGGYFNFQRGERCVLKPGSVRCQLSHCDKRAWFHKGFRNLRHLLLQREYRYLKHDCKVIGIHPLMEQVLVSGGVPKSSLIEIRNPIHQLSSERICAEQNREFLFVGRMVSEKGPQEFARAARQAGINARFIGSGDLLEPLKQQYPELEFMGWQEKDQIAQHLRSARCVVIPSLVVEAFGLVITEALSAGIPVIISHHCNLAEEIVQLGVGTSCDPLETDSFASLLKQFSTDDSLISQMSQNGPQAASQLGMTESHWVQSVLELYEERLAYAARQAGVR